MSGRRVAVFDCFSGIAGDMTLAALVDAGASLDRVREGVARLRLPPVSLQTDRVRRGGVEALHLRVEAGEERTFQPAEMRAMVAAAGFPVRVETRTVAAIDALAAGERAAHNVPEAHLHEAGGVDAMVDLAGTMLALEDLGIDDVWCPVVTVGAATMVKTAHGPIPAAPGPAAAHILEQHGFPMRFVEAQHELVTPTGAAILAAVARPGRVTIVSQRHGLGAGTFDPADRSNALRVFIGEQAAAPARAVSLLEANIDDMSPALLAAARDALLESGALDAWLEPIGMKKGRAASKLCALVPDGDEARFAAVFLRETTTLGVRVARYDRYEAARRIETFASSLGTVRVKVGEWAGTVRATPEHDDVVRLAAELGKPALEVQRALEAELRQAYG